MANAQEKNSQDTITTIKTERYGLRVGADLFRLSKSFVDKNYKGIEFVGDYRLTKDYYVAGELGNENKTVQEDYFNFTTKGTYFKVGFDYNAYKNWAGMENQIYFGVRYGVSAFSQTLNNYTIYTGNQYFPNDNLIEAGTKYDGLSATWGEIVTGVKAKMIDNFYMGFSFRINRLFSNKKPDGFDNLFIPGFNKTYSGTFGVGFNYSVSYFLPLYKSEEKIAKKIEKKK